MMQCTTDSRYIIAIDGEKNTERLQCIIVFDTKLQKASQLKGTFAKEIHGAVMMNNDMTREEFMTFAFVHCTWKESEFRNLQLLPRYLTQMVSRWYCNEAVYLFDSDGELHSIKVDDIIQCYHEQQVCP